MMYSSAIILVCVILACPLTSGKSVIQTIKDDHHFDYLLFAQFWPISSCVYLEEHHESCQIPSNVHDWTIHGLWPSRPGSELPQNCSSMPFNYSEIASLGPQLDRYWHYYKKDGERTFLWNHEWVKHGTCAYSLPALQGELNYFNRTLELHSQYNLTAALATSGIVPSRTQTYHMEDINKAVQQYYKVEPVIVCTYDRTNKTTYLDQIYLCFDKTFKLQNCSAPALPRSDPRQTGAPNFFNGCESKDKILYIPYNQNTQKPVHHAKSLDFQSERFRPYEGGE